MMVVGELQQSAPLPVVKAIKTQDLSGNELAQSLWELEVLDVHQNS